MALIEGLHIGLADGAHGARDCTGLFAVEQQMDMVVHQDVSMDQDGMVTASIAQETAIVMPILIVDENRAAVHAALGDVHRNPRDFDTCLTGHRLIRTEMLAACKVEVRIGISLMRTGGWANPHLLCFAEL